ncbi:DUF3413 domain-containing protein [Thalassotalea fusca]
MVSFGSSNYSKRLLHLISWSHWFTFFNIIVAIALSSFYFISESAPESALGLLYMLVNWVSHMGFLTFIGFLLIIFPITLLYPNTRFIRATASILFAFGLLLLLLDAFIYSRLGYHLNASSSEQIIALIQSQISQNNRLFWFVSLVLTISILAFELVVSNYAWKHLRDLQRTVFAKFVVFGLVSCFFVSHLLHIWADANLEYDILRQDTILPLSYPTTAKTLLTKYGMFDKADYIERRTSPLKLRDSQVSYPTNDSVCDDDKPKNSVYVVLRESPLTSELIHQFSQRTQSTTYNLENHIDNALPKNAWFNFIYSLPSIYQDDILSSGKKPVLFQTLENKQLSSSLTVISKDQESHLVDGFINLFDRFQHVENVAPLIFQQQLGQQEHGLHLFYFTKSQTFQYELFVDALLLSQKHKSMKDIIWIGSLGNQEVNTVLMTKPALLILPDAKKQKVSKLTSQMDVQPTLLENWFGCNIPTTAYSSGENIVELSHDRVIANTLDSGIVVFNKDKSVFIDQNGNFQSYSRQLEAPIVTSADFPLMIDGVHFIKQFYQQSNMSNNSANDK